MIQQNVSLKDLSFYKIGGPARYYFVVNSKEDLVNGMKEWEEVKNNLAVEARKYFVIGDATNLLIDDRGYNGLIIHNKIKTHHKISDEEIEFGSGLLFSEAVGFCTRESLSGLEWAGGLPGTVGGAIRGNAGAFGEETKDTVSSVTSVNLNSLQTLTRNNDQCQFDYRNSTFKSGQGQNDFIVSATFTLKQGNREEIIASVKKHVEYRKSHQPLDYPSAGSTFKNVDCRQAPEELVSKCQEIIKNDPFPVIPVAYLLSEADLKGERVGDAEISEKHPNFIINHGNAKASEVLALIHLAQSRVKEKYNVQIEPEIIILKH